MQKSSGIKLKDLAKLLEGELSGNGEILITGISGIREAKEGDITFVSHKKYKPELEKTKASAIISTRELTFNFAAMTFVNFELERWQSAWENRVRINLSESGVHPLSIQELLALSGGDDTMLRPWYGYRLWSYTENLTLLVPAN